MERRTAGYQTLTRRTGAALSRSMRWMGVGVVLARSETARGSTMTREPPRWTPGPYRATDSDSDSVLRRLGAGDSSK